jgi:DNA-binding NarL/FixJ family response regulator
MDGIECIQKLRDINPPLPTRFIVLTEHEDSPLVFDALKAGARGYLLKDCTSLNELAGSIRDVINDGAVMSPAIARKVIRYFRPQASPALASLSKRETEVLNCIADGLMYKEIAPKLGISMGTVCKHVAAIYAKLHVHSRTEAALKCAILLRR